MSNYPDDIRNYDHDPRSPFYVEPRCSVCEQTEVDCLCAETCESCGELKNDYFDECICEEEYDV